MRIGLALGSLLALSACDFARIEEQIIQVASIDYVAATNRAFAEAYQDQPFETGTVYVVAEEHGDLHTYTLTLCRGGTHVCGGSGGVGHLQQTLDFDIVTGAYPGRTFYLSPGGDGILKWRGVERDLAWN